MMWYGGLGLAICLLVVVAVSVWAARRAARPGARVEGAPALDTLRRRYAAGEISREEFERRRQALAGGSAASRGSTFP